MDIMDFIPKCPKRPEDMADMLDTLQDLIMKKFYIQGQLSNSQLANDLKVHQSIITKITQLLRKDEVLATVGASGGDSTGYSTDYVQRLHIKGMEQTKIIMERNSYCGPCPVTVEEYEAVTKAFFQATQNDPTFAINPDRVKKALSQRIGYQELNNILGQALCSKQPVFLYGGAGNGKTDLSSSLVKLLPPVIIPYAIEISKEILLVFDQGIHKPIEEFQNKDFDQRWVVCYPPMAVLGGEMTLKDLEINFDENYHAYQLPPHIKSNGGVLLIDDLGRQRDPVDAIFNRLIVPLEKRFDYMVFKGKRMEMMTDELFIFSTNLTPSKIMDPAFLRRIPYKIDMRNPTDQEFIDIWTFMAGRLGILSTEEDAKYALRKIQSDKREQKACQPRDLLRIIRDKHIYWGLTGKNVENQEIDQAYDTYFVVE